MNNCRSDKLYDVAVIGAGPSGNFAAITMAKKGLDVVVVDSREEIGNKLCTGIVGDDCVSLFPPDDGVIHRKISSAKLHSPAGNSYRIKDGAFSAWVLDRRAYVRDMYQQAERLGACYLTGHRVLEVNVGTQLVLIRTSKQFVVRARAILIASGFGTNILGQVGISAPSRKNFLQGSQVLVKMSEQDDVEVFIEGEEHPGAFTWLVPTHDDYGLLGAIYRPMDGNPIGRHIYYMGMHKKNFERIGEVENWGIPIDAVSKTFGARVLISGDAAGFTKPTTGGGIFYAMLSGKLAADTMTEAAIADDYSSQFLEQYQDKWNLNFGNELWVGRTARDLLEILDDKTLELLIEKFAVDIQEDLLEDGSLLFDWHSHSIRQTLKNRYVLELLSILGPKAVLLVAKILNYKVKRFMGI